MLTIGLLAAGCGPRPTTPEGFCAAQADAAPAVKALTISSVSSPYNQSRQSDLRAAARAQAITECLKRQGIVPAGVGVEGQPRTGTLFQE